MTGAERIECKTVIYDYKEQNMVVRFDSALSLFYLDREERQRRRTDISLILK